MIEYRVVSLKNSAPYRLRMNDFTEESVATHQNNNKF